MCETYAIIEGRKLDLPSDIIDIIKERLEEKNIFGRVDEGNIYYTINRAGYVMEKTEQYTAHDTLTYEAANYCRNKELMERRALCELLDRLLWRFSCQNGWDDLRLQDPNEPKYFISYCIQEDRFCVMQDFDSIGNKVYFVSYEIAELAIEEVVTPFFDKHRVSLELDNTVED